MVTYHHDIFHHFIGGNNTTNILTSAGWYQLHHTFFQITFPHSHAVFYFWAGERTSERVWVDGFLRCSVFVFFTFLRLLQYLILCYCNISLYSSFSFVRYETIPFCLLCHEGRKNRQIQIWFKVTSFYLFKYIYIFSLLK